MIILSFESKNKAREYFNFILSNASIKLETIVLNDFAYQYDYEICIDLLYSKSGDFLYNYEIFRVYVRVEDKKVLIFAEDELDILIDKLPTEKDKDNLYILLNKQGTK